MKRFSYITTKFVKNVSVFVLAAALFTAGMPTVTFAEPSAGDQVEAVTVNSDENSYDLYKESIAEYPNAESDIVIDRTNLTGGNASVSETTFLGEDGCINFHSGSVSANFTFNIPKTAKYNLMFNYAGLEGTSLDIQVAVYIDGKLLWDDLGDIELLRWWKNSADEWLVDRDGNQVTSEQIESFAFRKQYAYDKSGVEKDYYLFGLTAGAHTVKIVSKQEPFVLKNITFTAVKDIKSYKETADQLSGKSDYKGQDIVIQGEDASEKSSYTLTAKSDTLSSSVVPHSYSKNVINYIGSSNWSSSWQTIKWNVNIKNGDEGLYNIGFHYKQSGVVNGSVYRSLKIDGEYPFEEARDIQFEYGTKWQYMYLSDENGEPCKLYLDEGEHSIELEVTLGPISEYFRQLKSIVEVIGDNYLNIAMITGETPDTNRDYDLFVQIPNLENDFSWAVSELNSLSEQMSVMSEKSSSQYMTTIKGTTRILDQMMETKYLAHTYKSDLYSQYCNLSSLLYEMLDMPLSIDEIRLSAPGSEEPVYSTFFSQLKYLVSQFISTFASDYDGAVDNDEEYDVTLKLWTTWGRDQTQVLNTLISESFTPKTGIAVNVQITGATVIQGMLTNNAPDLALGVARSNPVNYALRGAVYDLSTFDDFDEVLERFNKGAEEPYRYNGGCYALPDTQGFSVMFYRTDILESLGLGVPETWDDFIEATAVIQRNNMNVYLPEPSATTGSLGIYPSMLMQKGIDIYNGDRNRNILDSDSAIEVFTTWTNFYTKYKIPVTSDFYNRFRVGVTPLGIAPYTTYTTLKEMAQDIEGRWKMALIPGTKTENGVSHISSGSGTGCIILNDSKHKDEAWEFLKWWTSADTQYRFSKNVESLLGTVGRVATSNKEAMKNYSWDSGDLEILMEQWNSVEEIPEVPGSYYLTRSVEQSFYAVKNGKSTSSDALIYWSGVANEEITRKIKEYS